MTFGSIRHEDGSQWDYYRCPMNRFGTKCYVTCGKEDLANYLKAVDEQTHPCYAKIPPEKFKCAKHDIVHFQVREKSWMVVF